MFLKVGTNGILTFGAGVSTYTPRAFPASSTPLLAPYWGDVDVRNGGVIRWGFLSASDRTNAARLVHRTWNPSNAFAALWDDVASYGNVTTSNSTYTDNLDNVIFFFRSVAAVNSKRSFCGTTKSRTSSTIMTTWAGLTAPRQAVSMRRCDKMALISHTKVLFCVFFQLATIFVDGF